MNLYLARHAQAKAEEQDPSRPLTELGWAQARRVAGQALAIKDLKIHAIYHSGKTRARQTAQVLADHLNPTKGLIETDGLKPLDPPTLWAGRIKNMNENIMLVGHLPHLSQLANLLLHHPDGGDGLQLENAAILALSRNEDGLWTLRWELRPDLLQINSPSARADGPLSIPNSINQQSQGALPPTNT